ncbi:hypothetical protein JMUB6875_34380 [Nocardia sp. JMUB6875]|uniref:hypothetical protein n=1 Tax=Nocardia sp. JMUB6875 TaxID=3158170 RepID=UPI0032E6BF70
MADHVAADFPPILAYGTEKAGIAAQVAGAAAADVGTALAQAVPTFGLIGQQFLAAFAVAQGNFLMSSAEIAAVHADTATTAYAAVGAFGSNEVTSAANFLSTVL